MAAFRALTLVIILIPDVLTATLALQALPRRIFPSMGVVHLALLGPTLPALETLDALYVRPIALVVVAQARVPVMLGLPALEVEVH